MYSKFCQRKFENKTNERTANERGVLEFQEWRDRIAWGSLAHTGNEAQLQCVVLLFVGGRGTTARAARNLAAAAAAAATAACSVKLVQGICFYFLRFNVKNKFFFFCVFFSSILDTGDVTPSRRLAESPWPVVFRRTLASRTFPDRFQHSFAKLN